MHKAADIVQPELLRQELVNTQQRVANLETPSRRVRWGSIPQDLTSFVDVEALQEVFDTFEKENKNLKKEVEMLRSTVEQTNNGMGSRPNGQMQQNTTLTIDGVYNTSMPQSSQPKQTPERENPREAEAL